MDSLRTKRFERGKFRLIDAAFGPDHHGYPTPPWPDQTEHVIVTEKDAVKLRPELWAQPGSKTRIWVAPLDFECDAAFLGELRALLPPPPSIRNADGYPTA